MTICLLPMPVSVESITKSLYISPFGLYSAEPIMVHPSFLFLLEPMSPQALIYNVVFLGMASPSIT